MPIEVKELVIRATVEARAGKSPAEERPAKEARPADRRELVAECVEQVLEILRRKNER